MYFQQGRLTLGKLYVSVPRKDTQDGFDLYSAQASFAWPQVDLSRPLCTIRFGLFGYISSLSKSAGFTFRAGKASLVSISDAILFLPS